MSKEMLAYRFETDCEQFIVLGISVTSALETFNKHHKFYLDKTSYTTEAKKIRLDSPVKRINCLALPAIYPDMDTKDSEQEG